MITSLARYFDGKTAKPHSVVLELGDHALRVASEAGALLGEWPYETLRDQNAKQSGDEVSLSMGTADQARVIVSDPAFIAELEKRCPRLRKRRPTTPGWWKPYAIWGGGAIVSIALIFTVVLPLLAMQVAQWIPDSVRADIGMKSQDFFVKAIAQKEKIDPEAVVCRTEEGQKQLEEMLMTLAAGLSEELPDLEVTVLKTKAINAFALPGGRLLVFSGLIDMAESPNGLAGVLAHELAHAENRHPTRLIVSNAGVATVFSLLLGDVSGGTFLAAMGQMAVGSAYSRDYEREADETGIKLMQAAQFDVSPMIPILEALAKKNDTETGSFYSLISSHPGLEERIALLEEAGNAGGTAMSDAAWQAVKSICR